MGPKGMETIRTNGCVEITVPYSDLREVRYLRMVAFNRFGMEKNSKIIIYGYLVLSEF